MSKETTVIGYEVWVTSTKTPDGVYASRRLAVAAAKKLGATDDQIKNIEEIIQAKQYLPEELLEDLSNEMTTSAKALIGASEEELMKMGFVQSSTPFKRNRFWNNVIQTDMLILPSHTVEEVVEKIYKEGKAARSKEIKNLINNKS